MNPFDQGYIAQLKGAYGDGAPAVHFMSEKEAAAYRAGARTCRADLAAEAADPKSSAGQVGDWLRRLNEFRAMAGEPNTFQREYQQTPIPPAETMRVTPLGEIKPILPVASPRAYAEPEPGAKKPRKAKPADENQGRLFG